MSAVVSFPHGHSATAVKVAHRLKATAVAETLLRLFRGYGAPRYVRSDNGREFMAKALKRRLKEVGVTCRHIDPGSPWPNGIKERFNGTLRWECLDMEILGT
ncbi:MAG: transposase family protein, partial [Nitrososphaerota archaeon]|nr:transposase family protein [Nitrososphaerota archaeon]